MAQGQSQLQLDDKLLFLYYQILDYYDNQSFCSQIHIKFRGFDWEAISFSFIFGFF